MALARAIFWPAAHMYVSFPSFNDHPWSDEVVHGRQFDVVLVTGHGQSIVYHWPVLVMVVGHVVRDKLPSVGHFSRYHYLVLLDVLLHGIYACNGNDSDKFVSLDQQVLLCTVEEHATRYRDIARWCLIKASSCTADWYVTNRVACNVPRFSIASVDRNFLLKFRLVYNPFYAWAYVFLGVENLFVTRDIFCANIPRRGSDRVKQRYILIECLPAAVSPG